MYHTTTSVAPMHSGMATNQYPQAQPAMIFNYSGGNFTNGGGLPEPLLQHHHQPHGAATPDGAALYSTAPPPFHHSQVGQAAGPGSAHGSFHQQQALPFPVLAPSPNGFAAAGTPNGFSAGTPNGFFVVDGPHPSTPHLLQSSPSGFALQPQHLHAHPLQQHQTPIMLMPAGSSAGTPLAFEPVVAAPGYHHLQHHQPQPWNVSMASPPMFGAAGVLARGPGGAVHHHAHQHHLHHATAPTQPRQARRFDRDGLVLALLRDLTPQLGGPRGPSAEALAELQRLCHRSKASDVELHTAWLDANPVDMCVGVASLLRDHDAAVRAARALREARVLAAAPGGEADEAERSPLWRDLSEYRGQVTIAAADTLLAQLHTTRDAEQAARVRAALDAIVAHVAAQVPLLASAQRGCIAVMRLLSAVHHDAALVTALVAALGHHAGALLDAVFAPYVLCHVISGLDPNPAGDAAAATAADAALPAVPAGADPALATAPQRRAAFIIDFSRWEADVSPATRGRCDAAAWAAFVDRVLAQLEARLPLVLRGRQQCFVLWHAARRLDMLRSDHGRAIVAALTAAAATAPWPPPQSHSDVPRADASATSAASTGPDAAAAALLSSLNTVGSGETDPANCSAVVGTPLLSAAATNPATALCTPMNALCRSTAGRCSIVAVTRLFDRPAGESAAALRANLAECLAALLESGVPAVDVALEATLKQRAGMEDAEVLEPIVRAFVQQTFA